ncbi:protein ninF, partial [Salmonella enterica subsp. enterica serovar Rissen]|nr:protein ninF [Salmonella enterica subsp. enterica serovar Rissen]
CSDCCAELMADPNGQMLEEDDE